MRLRSLIQVRQYIGINTTIHLIYPETVGSVILTLGLAGVKAKGQRNELTVLFDENDVVKKFNMSNSDIESGSLLFAN